MKIVVKLFAVAAERAGTRQIELELPEPATVADVRRQLAKLVPSLEPALPQMLFAVDTEYATDDTCLTTTSEVACIPPVSGGC